jgi:hypothetical protein
MDQGGIEPFTRPSAEIRQETRVLVRQGFEAGFSGVKPR